MLVAESRSSGLIVARDAMDENSVARALKQLDSRYVLQKHARDDAPGGFVYKVVCIVSDTRAPVVFTWVDDYGTPMPLSHALVEKVQSLMLGGRNKTPDEDELNHRMIAEKQRDAERLREAVLDDHRPFFERDRVSVAMGTGKPRYWKREGARPTSGKARS